jgi:type I restriction enzyme S subunit
MKKGWEVKKLSEIGKIFNGNSINARVKNDKYTGINNGLSFIATKDVGFDTVIDYENGVKIPEEEIHKFKIAPPNTPLICAEGGSAGRKIGFTNQDVCFGNKLFAIVPYKNIESRYIYYFYFSSIFQQHFATAMAGLIGGVSMNKFKNIEIPLPPLSEQKRIVTILDEAFTAIDKVKANTEKNLANTKELFEGYLESIYSQSNPEWTIIKLKDVLSKQPRNGWSPPSANHSDYGTPVLTLSSVTGFIFRGNKIKFTSAKTDTNRHYWVENGDLLITRSNTPELVGHVAIAADIEQPTIYPDLIMKMNCDYSKALTKFIYFQLRTKKLREIITGKAQGANPTMKKIGKEAVQTLPLRIPTIQTQANCIHQIEAIINETDVLEENYTSKVRVLDNLKKSILKKAFEGEL